MEPDVTVPAQHQRPHGPDATVAGLGRSRADVESNPPRPRASRVAIMRSAIGLMGRQGYEGTSTRDISNAAGISAAALYYHFPSKLDLLREFLFEAYDVVLGRMERDVAAAGASGRARLDAAVSTLIVSNLHSEWAQLASQVAWRELGPLAA